MYRDYQGSYRPRLGAPPGFTESREFPFPGQPSWIERKPLGPYPRDRERVYHSPRDWRETDPRVERKRSWDREKPFPKDTKHSNIEFSPRSRASAERNSETGVESAGLEPLNGAKMRGSREEFMIDEQNPPLQPPDNHVNISPSTIPLRHSYAGKPIRLDDRFQTRPPHDWHVRDERSKMFHRDPPYHSPRPTMLPRSSPNVLETSKFQTSPFTLLNKESVSDKPPEQPSEQEQQQQQQQQEEEEEEQLPSKEEIVNSMDKLDSEINTVEEEIEQFKKLKIASQSPADRTNLSDTDKILLTNQEIANAAHSYLKLFQAVEGSKSKTKPSTKYFPDNAKTHQLKRPIFLQYLRTELLDKKQKIQKLSQQYLEKKEAWEKTLQATSSVPSITLTFTTNPATTSTTTTSTVLNSTSSSANRITRRNRLMSNVVHSEEEFSQVIQQIREQEGTDPNTRYLKTIAKIPPLLIGKQEKQRRFIDTNRRIPDPVAEYTNFQSINPWTQEEEQIFLQNYLAYPKDFGKIATFLRNKTIEDVIAFYYKNKIRLNLKNLMLNHFQQKRRPPRSIKATKRPPSASGIRREVVDLQTEAQSSYWTLTRPSRDRVRTQVRTESKPFDSETSNTSPTPRRSIKPDKSSKPSRKSPSRRKNLNRQKKNKSRSIKQSGEGSENGNSSTGDLPACWTDSDISLFKQCLGQFGKDFKKISETIGSKNQWQCQSFYYNHRKQMSLDNLIPNNISQTQYPSILNSSQPTTTEISNLHHNHSEISNQTNINIKKESKSSFAISSLISHEISPPKISLSHKASIASLLNSPSQSSPDTSIEAKNWVLEETSPQQISTYSSEFFSSSNFTSSRSAFVVTHQFSSGENPVQNTELTANLESQQTTSSNSQLKSNESFHSEKESSVLYSCPSPTKEWTVDDSTSPKSDLINTSGPNLISRFQPLQFSTPTLTSLSDSSSNNPRIVISPPSTPNPSHSPPSLKEKISLISNESSLITNEISTNENEISTNTSDHPIENESESSNEQFIESVEQSSHKNDHYYEDSTSDLQDNGSMDEEDSEEEDLQIVDESDGPDEPQPTISSSSSYTCNFTNTSTFTSTTESFSLSSEEHLRNGSQTPSVSSNNHSNQLDDPMDL